MAVDTSDSIFRVLVCIPECSEVMYSERATYKLALNVILWSSGCIQGGKHHRVPLAIFKRVWTIRLTLTDLVSSYVYLSMQWAAVSKNTYTRIIEFWYQEHDRLWSDASLNETGVGRGCRICAQSSSLLPIQRRTLNTQTCELCH